MSEPTTLREAVCEELTRHGVEFDHDDMRSTETGLNASEELAEDIIAAVLAHLVVAAENPDDSYDLGVWVGGDLVHVGKDVSKWLTNHLTPDATGANE